MTGTDLDARLDSLDRDQLAALVRRLLLHSPELEDLVHLTLPGEEVPPDPRGIAAQATAVLLGMGSDWRASTLAERQLAPLVDIGDGLLQRGRVADAGVAYAAVAKGILARYTGIWDNESEVAGVVIGASSTDSSLGIPSPPGWKRSPTWAGSVPCFTPDRERKHGRDGPTRS